MCAKYQTCFDPQQAWEWPGSGSGGPGELGWAGCVWSGGFQAGGINKRNLT